MTNVITLKHAKYVPRGRDAIIAHARERVKAVHLKPPITTLSVSSSHILDILLHQRKHPKQEQTKREGQLQNLHSFFRKHESKSPKCLVQKPYKSHPQMCTSDTPVPVQLQDVGMNIL